ncbi:MAG: hypothetical protein PQ612_06100 [Rickettsiales bacterium]|nr:hypothetical protein [Pseudomonadota bacterium]MDA0966896.1 hypothetical protein [Pseudomonadota bacterium]MDG4543571.1 hypothetical protein [Rickettsiales bacterium]MDG4545719.1 hypothetical protein [Rickettsiales bacterium]MDG4547508.1 hypothetical protein [Rickettsiales bacterium]
MYENVRSRMKTGDVISFSGKSDISNIIKAKTDSDISHVAMVLKKQLLDGKERVLIIESTSLNNLPDIYTGKLFKGVQIQYLSDRMNDYSGQVYWRRVRNPLSEGEKAKLVIFLMMLHKMQIEYDTLGAIGAGCDLFDILFANVENHEKLFCSELVAAAFEHIGLLPRDYNTSEATPADVIKYPFLGDRVQIK